MFQRYYQIEKTEMAENLNSRGLRFWTRVVRFRWSLWCSRRWWLDWSTFSNNSPLLLSSPRQPPEAPAGYLHETSFGSPEHDQKSHKSLIEPQAKLQFSSSSSTPKSLSSSPLLYIGINHPWKLKSKSAIISCNRLLNSWKTFSYVKVTCLFFDIGN